MNKGFLRIGKWFFKPQELKDKSLGSRSVEPSTHPHAPDGHMIGLCLLVSCMLESERMCVCVFVCNHVPARVSQPAGVNGCTVIQCLSSVFLMLWLMMGGC